MKEQRQLSGEKNQKVPEGKLPYETPEIVKIDLDIKDWKGYVAAGCGSTCCVASVVAGAC